MVEQAVLNTDYSLSSSTITVSAGSTTGTITLTCIDDSLWSGDMTMSFEVSKCIRRWRI